MSIEQAAASAIHEYETGQLSYPRFVLALEHAVDAAEQEQDSRAGDFRRLWGGLEIVNALRDSEELESTNDGNVRRLIGEIQALLSIRIPLDG